MTTPRRRSTAHRSKPDPSALRLGRRVRTLRQEKDFNFDAFVEETGLGRGYISELERGLVVPSLTVLTRIAEALETTVSDLVAGHTAREKLLEATRRLGEADVLKVHAFVSQLEQSSKPISPSFKWVRRSKGALPFLTVRPAAGVYSESHSVKIKGWVELQRQITPTQGRFVAQVDGPSMAPRIQPGDYCVFERPWRQPQPDEIGIFMVPDETLDDGGSFTLKSYHPNAESGPDGLFIGGELRALNPRARNLAAQKGDLNRERPFARWLLTL